MQSIGQAIAECTQLETSMLAFSQERDADYLGASDDALELNNYARFVGLLLIRVVLFQLSLSFLPFIFYLCSQIFIDISFRFFVFNRHSSSPVLCMFSVF